MDARLALALFGAGAIVDTAMFTIRPHRFAARLAGADRRFTTTRLVALTAGLAALGFKAAFATFIPARSVVATRRARVTSFRLAVMAAIGTGFAARLRGTLGARLARFLLAEISAAEVGILSWSTVTVAATGMAAVATMFATGLATPIAIATAVTAAASRAARAASRSAARSA